MKHLTVLGLVLALVLMMSHTVLGASNEITLGEEGSISYKLFGDINSGSYKLNVLNGDEPMWRANSGSIGLRTVSTSNQVSDWSYKGYDMVISIEGGYEARGSITSVNGSVIDVVDVYKMDGGGLNIEREIQVITAGNRDKGFQVDMPLRSAQALQPENLKWFTPSSWYGNDGDNFLGNSKMAFDGIEASSAADNLGIPMIYNYDPATGWGLTVTDITGGLKETIKADDRPDYGKILVDERINVPGVGMRKEGGQYTEVYQAFPGHTYNYRNRYNGKPVLYRFTPMTSDLRKTTAIRITYRQATDFLTGYRDAWRENYDRIAVVDKRVDPKMHFKTLVQYMDDSFGIVDGRPQYCANYDHKNPTSGFLWRNADLAWIMLAQGWEQDNDTYKEHARTVLNDQVQNGILDGGRPGAEGYLALIRAYNVDKAKGIIQSPWLNKCITYANGLPAIPDYYHIPFLVELYKVTANTDYLNKAKSAGDSAWYGGHNTLRFRNSLTDYAGGPPEHDREAGYLALESYMALYQETKEEKWLERAKVAADFSETWSMVQNLKTNPEDASLNSRMYGNDIPPYGLSGVHAGSNTGDQYQALNAVEFYQLYEATGDEHYLDFTEYIEYNSLLYTNLGDKQGYMADWIKGTGYGFTNEYLGTAANTYHGNARRGDGHDSNLGWTSYVLLAMTQRTKDYVGRYILTNTNYEPLTPQPDSPQFTEDFQRSSGSTWRTYGGNWSLNNGQYTVSKNAGAKSMVESTYYTDLSYEVDLRVGNTGDAGIIFRNNGSEVGANGFTGYYLGLKPEANEVVLGKANGGWKQIASKSTTLQSDTTYRVKVVAVGPVIQVYLNNGVNPIIEVTDYSWIKGHIGLRTYAANAQFDNIVVKHVDALPEKPSVLFRDDFDDNILTSWDIYGGQWNEIGEKLSVEANPGAKVVADTIDYKDFMLEGDIQVGASGNAGFVLRVSEPAEGADNYKGYYVGLNAGANKIEVGKASPGWSPLHEVSMTINANQSYHVKIIMVGNQLQVYVDNMDEAKVTLTDDSWSTGKIGLRTYQADASFDNIILLPAN